MKSVIKLVVIPTWHSHRQAVGWHTPRMAVHTLIRLTSHVDIKIQGELRSPSMYASIGATEC